jgi:hypothetical protein
MNPRVHCGVCGHFNIFEAAMMTAMMEGISDAHIYSGALREHALTGNSYQIKDFDDLRHSVWIPENPIEQIDKLLLALERATSYFGETLTLNFHEAYSYAYAKNGDEFFELIRNAHSLTYIEFGGNFPTSSVKLMWRGAERLAELHRGDVNSNQAFVAMWFHPRTDVVFSDGIEPALDATGFKALRVDKKEFNHKIDDEIIASIRRSGLVIADVTGHRQGVYYEAGYAQGLGIPVIWTCWDKFLGKAHFDIRQFNHINWKDPEDLKERLINRIEATRPIIRLS